MEIHRDTQDTTNVSEVVEQLLYEHRILREEILHNESQALQIFAGTVVAVGTITTLVFSSVIQHDAAKAIVLLVSAWVPIIGQSQAIVQSNSTYRIATYLRTFVEPKLGHVKWETRLKRFREHRDAPKDPFNLVGSFSVYELRAYSFMSIALFLGGIFHFWRWYSPASLAAFLRAILIWIPVEIYAAAITIFLAILLFAIWYPRYHRGKHIGVHGKRFDRLWGHIALHESGAEMDEK